MDFFGLDDLINGAPDDEHVICPTCVGSGYTGENVSWSTLSCERCLGSGYIPTDEVTPEERATLESLERSILGDEPLIDWRNEYMNIYCDDHARPADDDDESSNDD